MALGWMLSPAATSTLVDLPETGMGFQLVGAKVQGADGILLVLNSELAFDISGLILSPGFDPSTIASNGARVMDVIKNAQVIVGRPEPTSFALLNTRIGSLPSSSVTSRPAPAPVVAAASSLVKSYSLTVDRVFHRYSAFNPDRRVNSVTGDFVAGTYATPDSETPFVPTGFVAVGRFALPNLLPASHHYVITAPVCTFVSFGTVAPAFGQAGGGVEVLFTSAVTNAATTLISPPKLPDE